LYSWPINRPPERDTKLFSSASALSCRYPSQFHYTKTKFLQVIDEADRLLAQSFQSWLAQVLAATRPSFRTPSSCPTADLERLPQPDAMAPAFMHLTPDVAPFETTFDEAKESSCQKLLFSATLTRDPGKIAALDLKNPKYFVVQSRGSSDFNPALVTESFSMPATLSVGNGLSLLITLLTHSNTGAHDCLRGFKKTINAIPSHPFPRH
jgi:superfamily II DNA/RNA helicase